MSSENTTENLPDAQSFENRVLAALADIAERLERLEAKQYDTRPIWEQALAEILETRNEMRRGFRVVSGEMFGIRPEQQRTDERLSKLESPHS